MANAEVSIINEQHQFAINMSIPFNGLSPKIFNDHRLESLFFVVVNFFLTVSEEIENHLRIPAKKKICS